jgi:putative hemolysin
MGGIWLGIGAVGLAFSTLLSCLAQSLRELSRVRLEEIAALHKKPGGVARAAAIVQDVPGHFAAVAFPRVACNLIVMLGIVLWVRELRSATNTSSWWIEVSVGAVAASFLLWMFSVVIPSAVAKHAAEATVYAWSPLVRLIYLVLKPFAFVPRIADEAVRRLAGKSKEDSNKAVEHELLSVVDDAQEEGRFDEAERDMIEAVVKFRNRTVTQVMTPRTEIEAMPVTHDLSKVTAIIRRIGHSRIPVYDGDLDHVVGVFYVKDLMKWLAGEGSRSGKPFDLRSVIRPAHFVPETKTVRELLAELLARRVHIAVVADEYGGTAGIVTIEDIMEEVFGDIQDEYEVPEEVGGEVVIHAAVRAAEVDARAYIENANAVLSDVGVELPTSDEYDTVGGFVTVALGRIPAKGERFTHGGLEVTVLDAEPTRVTKVRVSALPEAGGADEDGIIRSMPPDREALRQNGAA